MREIKFRAWDKEKKVMLNSFKITDWEADGGYGDCYNPKNANNDNYSILDIEKDCIIMQYTGLKDKNGVKIYEGDIVENEAISDTVIFHRGVFTTTRAMKKFNCGQPLGVHINLEVIGNIYQNPELLEEAK